MAIVPMQTAEEKQILATYLANKMGMPVSALVGDVPFQIVAVARAGFPVGAVLYINQRGPFEGGRSIEMACAGEPRWLTSRDDLRNLFAYPFVQLGCYTVISLVKRSNTTARKFNEKLGFVPMGAIESGLGKSEDTILHTMARPNCRWLTPADHALVAARHLAKSTSNGVTHGRQSTGSP